MLSVIKMFSKYEQRCLIKIQIATGKNARQYHTANYSSSRAVCSKISTRWAVDGISRLPDVWRRVLHVGGDYFWSLKQCDCSKNIFFVVNSNVATNYWMIHVVLKSIFCLSSSLCWQKTKQINCIHTWAYGRWPWMFHVPFSCSN